MKNLETKNFAKQQLKCYKIMAVPMLTYARENWTINRSDKKKIESAEIKFLRSVARYNLLDQKHSTDIRSELNIFNLTNRIEKQKENCHEHILRMTTDRLSKVLTKLQTKKIPKYRTTRKEMGRRILLKSEAGLQPISLK
jgi:hypothetical protein